MQQRHSQAIALIDAPKMWLTNGEVLVNAMLTVPLTIPLYHSHPIQCKRAKNPMEQL